jgi:Fe-S cluster biogenesis protein NfuA
MCEEKGELKTRVEEVLGQVRPALIMDGGNVELVGVNEEEGIVMVRLTGACQGCPSASMTLLYGVEARIRQQIPEIKQVVAV